MRVFITGSSGWIGSAAVAEFVGAGHHVVGLVRSDTAASAIETAGATAFHGDLDDLESLRRGVTGVDAVVHLANKHDFADPEGGNRTERAAVEAMLGAVRGTGATFLVANGLSGLVDGRAARESDPSPAVGPDADRGGSENLVLDHDDDVRGMAMRFAPSVHGAGDWGFVAFLADIARRTGVSGYIGDGQAQWSAVHRSDAARLIRVGVENAPAGTRLHAVAEHAVATRAIAEALGDALRLPVTSIDPDDAGDHFGFMAEFFGTTMTGENAATRTVTGWDPSGPTLLDDIAAGAYSTAGQR